MTGVARSARMPRDVRARERLREAQLRESEAVAAVCAAHDALARAAAKRDAVLASATATVDQAHASVQAAQAALVQVSGADRAAQLLGVDPAEMRKSRNGRRADA
jgi:hypothetical protein